MTLRREWWTFGFFLVMTVGCAGGEDRADASEKSPSSGGASENGGEPLPASEVEPDVAWGTSFEEAAIDVETTGNDCNVSVEVLENSAVGRVVGDGSRMLYVGYAQVSSNNQDPVVALVDGEEVVWCKHHEDDAPDGRAVGVSWNGGSEAYVTYTVVGGGTDLEGKGGWLPSYAPGALSGGGVKVSVVGRVDIETGALMAATFVIAVKMDGKVNSLVPLGAAHVLEDGSVEFLGESAHKPIGADGSESMTCTDYPFDVRYRFSPDLQDLICAESTNCSDNMIRCP